MIQATGIRIICLSWMFSASSNAALLTFTDPSLFANALLSSGSSVEQIDFDASPANTPIPHGNRYESVVFEFLDSTGTSFDGMVASGFNTTSGDNYLGFNDPGANPLLSGDAVSFGFAQNIYALGLYIIASPGDFGFVADALLIGGNTTASNAMNPTQTLSDGAEVFFLGLIDSDGFSSAQLTTACCGFFEFNIDDILLASFPATATPNPVPSPGVWLLVLSGLPLLGFSSNRKN